MKLNLNLRCAHLNVRSLIPHINEVKNIILSHNLDILCISETWLDAKVSNNLVNIKGYFFHRIDRLGRGGGVGVYLRDSIKFESKVSSRDIEQLWLKLILKSQTLAIGVVYRPPNYDIGNFFDKLETTITDIIPTVDNILCLGEFVTEVLESLGLVQMIKQPTRITDKTATLIDYALVSNVNLVKEVGTKHVPEVSDHELVFLSLKIGHKQKKINYKTTRNFKNFNYAQFDSDLRSIPWNTIYELDDVDSKVGFLSDSINALLDIHAPFQTFRITKTYAPWLTNSIKAMMKDRDEALSKFKKTKNLQHWKDYKQLRNLVTRIVKHEKKIFCKINIEKNKSTKNMWGNIRKIFHDHDKRDIQLPSNFDNVNLINDHFVNSIPGSTPDEKIINYYKTNVKDKLQSQLEFETVDEIEVLKIITNIKNKSVGHDGINSTTLQLCLPFLLPHITHIVNKCLKNATFPTIWKKAHVIPVPKTPNPQQVNDLRPISILPTLSKILEKAIHIQIHWIKTTSYNLHSQDSDQDIAAPLHYYISQMIYIERWITTS